MKIIAISDTHGQHNSKFLNNNLSDADMIIHAGDISSKGKEESVVDFLNWFSSLDYKYKIFIAGNHDFFFEKKSKEYIKNIIPENVIYLNDEFVEIEGLKIYGSPIQPYFFNWAFNRRRGAEIQKHWDLIPDDIDLLITHGPALGILDETTRNDHVGCLDLFNKIKELKIKAHVFGHIHEAYGVLEKFNTKFINASNLNHKYKLKNLPIVFEI